MGLETDLHQTKPEISAAEQFAALIGVELAPERQKRFEQECDLLRASFFVRTEVFRLLDNLNTTKDIGENSAMVETLTTAFLSPNDAKDSEAPLATIILPENLTATAEVLRDILKGHARAPRGHIAETGLEQITTGVQWARAARESNTPARTLAILDIDSDWDAVYQVAAIAAEERLSSLTCIINVQAQSDDAKLMWAVSWRALGWDVSEVSNGHSPGALRDAIEARSDSGRPRVILVNTCCGKSLPFQGESYRNHPPLSQAALRSIIDERDGIEQLSSEGIERSIERLLA